MVNRWYENNIESPVRNLVRHLRNYGINTVGSCGHDRWVSIEPGDIGSNLSVISIIMQKLRIQDYYVEVRLYGTGSLFMDIYIPDENGEYYEKSVKNRKYIKANCKRIK